MSELVFEQALDALKTLYEGITTSNESTGDPYWYKPSVVLRRRIREGPMVRDLLNEEFPTIYAILQDRLLTSEETASTFEMEGRYFLFLARFHGLEDAGFDEQTPLLDTVQNRLIHDAIKRKDSDIPLGGIVENNELVDWEYSFYGEWALALGRGVMSFDVDAGVP